MTIDRNRGIAFILVLMTSLVFGLPISAQDESIEEIRNDFHKQAFKESVDYLDDAVRAFDEHEHLEEWNWFSIGTSKDENVEKINELLDKAVEVLAISEIAESRQAIREAEANIEELQLDIDEYNLSKVSAKSSEKMGTAEKWVKTSREDYEAKIEKAKAAVDAERNKIREIKGRFADELRAIGVDIDPESAETLLSTISGKDLVDLCIVFDNIKYITVELEKLTEDAGESGETARRYYGMYVMLIRIMDRIQKSFVQGIEERFIPKLESFRAEAEKNIAEARRNMRSGGSREIGENNIRINNLTLTAVKEYKKYLEAQASLIRTRNKQTERDLKDALNTYNSVKLSTNVSAILRAGSKNFFAVSRLQIPDLRVFESKELRDEFDRLTLEMSGVE